MLNPNYKLVIGLEIHCQINSIHKLFSLAANSGSLDQKPNTTITNLEMGVPGILPIVNREPIVEAVKAGLAFNGTINKTCFFDRKHYFYPDLPSGYQITQFFVPIIEKGYLKINTINGEKTIRIKQMHIEADAGKNIHSNDCSLLDYNRVSVGLIESVTEPDINSPEEALAFAEEFHNIMNYINVCTGDMEKGHFRMDVNISVEELSTGKKSNRVEIKNLNSFHNMMKAINYEYERHVESIKNNEVIPQSTRFFDAEKGKTGLLRLKESSSDYKYIRDGDLPPLILTTDIFQEAEDFLKDILLPQECRKILMGYGLSEKQSYEITKSKDQWNYFNKLLNQTKNQLPLTKELVVKLFNLLTMDLATLSNKYKIAPQESHLTIENILDILESLENKKITGVGYKILLEELWNKSGNVQQIIKEKNLEIINDDSIIVKAIEEVINENPDEVKRYKNGEIKLFAFFVGQVMKKTKGKGNPESIGDLLKNSLNK